MQKNGQSFATPVNEGLIGVVRKDHPTEEIIKDVYIYTHAYVYIPCL